MEKNGLNCKNQNKLFELGMRYISLNKDEKEPKSENKEKYELDFNKCIGLIKASFKFDYNYDPYELEYLHWYDFYNDLESLSTSEFGNCCILNRVTGILNQEPKEIKDNKTRKNLIKSQELLKKKYCKAKMKESNITKAQEQSAIEFYKSLGIEV